MRITFGRIVTILTFAATFLGFAGGASASEAAVRTHVAPTLRAGAEVAPRLSLQGGATFRILADDPTDTGDRLGVFAGAGVMGAVHPAVSLGVHYGYGYGRFPIEGPWRQEHRTTFSVLARTPGRRIFAANLARVDLRAVQDQAFAFRVRPRNELSATAVLHPLASISVSAEGLLSPGDGVENLLQVRTGLALHGFAGGKTRPGQKRPGPAIGYAVGAQLATLPIAMWKARGQDIATLAGGDPAPAVPLDVLVSISLSGRF